MYRPISVMVVLFGTIVWTMTGLAVRDAAAATPAAQGQVSAIDPSDIDGAEQYERAEVTLDGEVLFQVRGFATYLAAQRVRATAQRIEAIAADRSVRVDSLLVVDLEDRTRIMAGDRVVMGIIDLDVSPGRFSPKALKRIAVAITSYRGDRSPHVLAAKPAQVPANDAHKP